MRLNRLPLRMRLVAGFSAAMLVVLTAAAGFVYWRVAYALDRGLDTELAHAMGTLRPMVNEPGPLDESKAAATGVAWQVLSPDGTVVEAGGGLADEPVTTDLRDGAVTDVGTLLPATDQPYRLNVAKVTTGWLVVGVRRDHRDEALRELLGQLVIAVLGSLVIAAFVGDLLARFALRPVENYRRRAELIAHGDVSRRLDVPAERDDEITRLGHTLNEMLDGLERSIEQERRFVDDASHELRTPITVIKSRIQLARRRDRSVAEHEAILAALEVDVARLETLAQELLDLSASAGQGDCEVASVAATLDVDQEVATGPLIVGLTESAVRRILINLAANAETHGAPPVQLVIDRQGDWIRIAVTDHGPGMTPELLATATGRFTRAPEARTRPGAGLGLSLVDALVRESGGELRLCFDGAHSEATRAPACEHGPAMTATVFLPSTS